jgi:late competence protein required for DNA uptake (superfamily II DNA/RNA helicase)
LKSQCASSALFHHRQLPRPKHFWKAKWSSPCLRRG